MRILRPRPKQAPCLRSLQTAIARLARDQQGVALTEFVICLPVFILIFVGVVNLNKIQAEGMAVKMRATKNLWTEAIPVQKSDISARMLPLPQGTAGGIHIASHLRFPVADGVGGASNAGLAATGHFGESYALVLPVDLFANIWFEPPSLNIIDHLEPDQPDHNLELTLRGRDVYNNQKYAGETVDDGMVKALPSASGPLDFLSNAITISGARPAIAAGIRYGLAVGENSSTVNFAGRSVSLSAGYDVLVAPKPTPEIMATAVTRLGIEGHDQLKWVLGIEAASKL